MKKAVSPFEYKGRTLGIVALVAVQVLIGFVHVVFGFWLLVASWAAPLVGVVGSFSAGDIYSIYTIIFGFLTLLFAVPLWLQKRWGWVGTFAVLIFVVAADSLTLLDLPSIPGIPKFAGFGEITYSILVIAYLLQAHIRAKYKISF
jgi:hypothetical protein